MADKKLRQQYKDFKKKLPMGIYRALMSILENRYGIANAISNDEIIHALKAYAIDVDKRQVREAIRDLRVKDGILIASNSGDGYWLAEGREECTWFISETRRKQIDPIEEMLFAFSKAADEAYGAETATQLDLFGGTK